MSVIIAIEYSFNAQVASWLDMTELRNHITVAVEKCGGSEDTLVESLLALVDWMENVQAVKDAFSKDVPVTTKQDAETSTGLFEIFFCKH